MDIDNTTVCNAVQLIFKDWHWIRDTVIDFGFKDYLKRVHGLEYRGGGISSFKYTITNEQKFMWFMLKYGNHN
jgi:hypothetical protein